MPRTPSSEKEKAALEGKLAKYQLELSTHKASAGDTSKSLAAMQAVSQASSDKLEGLHKELKAAKETENDLRIALDKVKPTRYSQERKKKERLRLRFTLPRHAAAIACAFLLTWVYFLG